MVELSPEEMVAKVREEHANRRETRRSRATKSRKQVDIIAAWQRAYLSEKHSERYSTPTRKEIGIFLRHFTRYAAGRDIAQLLQSICTRWDDLRMGPMSWHDAVPRLPSFSFIAHHLRFFVNALDELETQPHNQSVDGPAKPITHGKRKRRSWRDLNRVD